MVWRVGRARSNAPHSKCGKGEISSQVQILCPPLVFFLYTRQNRCYDALCSTINISSFVHMTQISVYISIFSVFLALISLVSGVLAWLRLKKTQKKLEILFSGKEAVDLETVILNQGKEILAIDKEIQELFEISNKIHNLSQKSVHKVGIIRFNPFKDIGGDQSFALALLDGKDSGITISSLHTREGTRIYAKPVIKGESEKYTLTDEEKAAIKAAVTIKPTKI